MPGRVGPDITRFKPVVGSPFVALLSPVLETANLNWNSLSSVEAVSAEFHSVDYSSHTLQLPVSFLTHLQTHKYPSENTEVLTVAYLLTLTL